MSREQEAADAVKVDEAVEAIDAGDYEKAEKLLLEVVANTPEEYQNVIETEGTIYIKSWDLDTFLHYLNWQQQHGNLDHNVHWFTNAYPRAYYYLGFLAVHYGDYDQAISYLDSGRLLDSQHPRLRLEKAQALIGKRDFQAALDLLEQINNTGPFVINSDLAAALRSRAFILVEMGDFNHAREILRAALQLDPDNLSVLDELEYISNLTGE